jgi:magnesium-transporting ATPase (P-type)
MSATGAVSEPQVFVDVVRSEWTKLRTVRSTYWSVLAAIVAGVGLSAAISAATASAYSSFDAHDRLTFDPTSISLAGLFFSQLALGVVGVLGITAEFSTGMIRTTLSAVPQRGMVVVAKSLVLGVAAFVVGVITSFAAFFVGQAIFSSKHLDVSISDAGVLRAVFGGSLYLAVLVLFALGIGLLIRHSAGAITTLVGVVFILPGVTGALPDKWQHDFARYLPANAGGALTNVKVATTSLSPWVGFLVFCAWAGVALVVGGYLLRRRDV